MNAGNAFGMPVKHARAAMAQCSVMTELIANVGVWVVAVTTALTVAACSEGPRVVTTDDTRPPTEVAAPTSSVVLNDRDLVNSFDYFVDTADRTGYYFTTPSGRWNCAIIARSKAGCQSASEDEEGLGISGQPTTEPDAEGETTEPTAIVVGSEGDAAFVWMEQEEFALVPGPAKELGFNTILAVGGFRCNVQEASGISCLNEQTGKGFTFSADGYTLTYTDVPI